MLLVPILIHAMMQQMTVAEEFDCSRFSCKTDCPVDFNRFQNATNSNALTNEFNRHTRADKRNLNVMICCSVKCNLSCITSDNEIVPKGTEWIDPEDSCTSHICNNGIISTFQSVCAGLPCDLEYHIRRPGECCSTCDPSWASFCQDPENEDCDMSCRYGFIRDQQRDCDLCRCLNIQTETPTSVITTSEPASSNDAPKTVNFYFYLDPSDGATKYLTIGLAIACCVILMACLAAFGWYFHRRIYKKVPLLAFRSSSSA